MNGLTKLMATVFGIGYIQKGAGTLAALFYCALWWLALDKLPLAVEFLLIVLLFLTGALVSSRMEKAWGPDSNKIVIDEVLGMAVSVVMMPHNIFLLLTAFVLFRFFDIAKPLYIRRAEALPGGWGVMADDLLAGLYTNLLLHVVLFCGISQRLVS